ncbi:MAG: MBL fold metallo-hydrolase [Candidatus Thorarchaeota archaeon]|jgi:glyoxylase-like metal-dependent hydrolase (beta-lactamase superfamily II)
MSLEQVGGRVWADTSGTNGGNYGAVILSEEIVMVDSGMYHQVSREVHKFIKDLFEPTVSKLVYTHSHRDHVFGAQAFRGALTIGSQEMLTICLQNLEGPWSRDSLLEQAKEIMDSRPLYWEAVQEILLPESTLTEPLELGEGVTVRHVGGHTGGSLVVIVEPEHILFSGDLIFNKSFPYAGDSSCDPDRWIQVLEELLAEQYNKIIPGHGELCDDEALEDHLDLLKTLRANVKKGLADGLSTQEFISKERVPDYYTKGAEHRVQTTVEHWFEFYGG